jgi:hypothetical protein
MTRVAQAVIRTATAIALLAPSIEVHGNDDCGSAFVPDFPPTETDWSQALTKGDRVRIHVRSRTPAESREPIDCEETWWNEQALWAQPIHGSRERLAWDDIERVDVRTGSTNKGKVTGAWLGFLAGVGVTAIVAATADDSGWFGNEPLVFLTALVALPVGALIGAAIGSHPVEEWQPVVCAEAAVR